MRIERAGCLSLFSGSGGGVVVLLARLVLFLAVLLWDKNTISVAADKQARLINQANRGKEQQRLGFCMGSFSFGMDWNQKASVLWDWENLPPIGANDPRMTAAPQAEPKFAADLEATRHGSVLSSSCGTFSSSSEMGYGGSSKSSVSASTDSSPKTKGNNNMELNFAPAKAPDKNTDSGKVDDTRTSSPSSVIAISSGEPVLSLKLGKRTYFEDVYGGGGQSVKSLPADTSAVTPHPASAKKAKAAPNKQKSYCQVEGCKVDLSSAKEYHRKHRVCGPHSKAPKVVVAGLERRFCQQCSRFHGLAEFDQKKKSCRRRLNDHNARRRKSQPEALSFGSSRLSAMFYDTRQQTSLLFGQGPYGQMRSCASSSWDNPGGGFKFAETKAPLLRAATVDGLHQSSQQVWNNFMPLGVHQDFDGFMAFKGTSAKVLDQGVEASAAVSNPDLQRALSLLSISPAGAAGTNHNQQQATAQLHHHHHHHHGGLMSTLAASSNSVMQQQASSSPGLWQDGPDAHAARFQAVVSPGSSAAAIATAAAQEMIQLPRPPPSSYGSSSPHYDDLMRRC